MTQQATTWRRCRPAILGTLLFVMMTGCNEEPRIAQYEVPREAETRDFRRLGAIILFQDKVWFFKLDGPQKSLADEKDRFDKFVQSIQFSDKSAEPSWKLPEGWRQEPGDGKFRFATIRLGPPEQGMELTVIPLPRDSEDWLLKNVNRWRDQIGLAPIRESELAATTKKAKIDGKEATLVDLLGRKPRSKMPPMGQVARAEPRARPQAAAEGGPKPSYELPPGWRPLRPKVSPFVRQLLSFEVGEGDKIAKITATPAGGDLLSNVNRWRRDDLGLPETTETAMRRELTKLKVAGVEAFYVDLHSPQAATRILGVIVPLREDRGPQQSLFFKMIGPADLVSEQKRNFDGFIRSFRFGDDGK